MRNMWIPPKPTIQVLIQGSMHFSFDQRVDTVITPHTHPNPTCYVAPNIVCKVNDVITPHPHMLRGLKMPEACVQVQPCHHTPPPPQPHMLRSIKHVCKFNHVITPHPTPQPHMLRGTKHVCKVNDVITPHPHMLRGLKMPEACVQVQPCHHNPHPPQPHMLRSIKHVCKFNDLINTPHPPQPHMLHNIKHVCKFNDVITPHTHPKPTCYVTSNMCASSTMSLHLCSLLIYTPLLSPPPTAEKSLCFLV